MRLVIFKEDRVGGRARVTIDEERVLWHGTRLNRNQVVQILSLASCENLIPGGPKKRGQYTFCLYRLNALTKSNNFCHT